MRSIFILLTVCLLSLSCNDGKTKTSTPTESVDSTAVKTTAPVTTTELQRKDFDSYFKATGTEPFWSLSISDKGIKLKTINDSILTPHTEPIKAQDANVKLYKLETERAAMTIEITQNACTNAMSGKSFPYSVTVDYKIGRASEFTTIKGCGQYFSDYRLHDIWVLERLNGNTVQVDDFARELPFMEIDTNTDTFAGYAGCNRMHGQLFSEKDLLRFTNVAITEMWCGETNKETDFISALRSSTTYKIEQNRLWLSNPSEEHILVFKKVD